VKVLFNSYVSFVFRGSEALEGFSLEKLEKMRIVWSFLFR